MIEQHGAGIEGKVGRQARRAGEGVVRLGRERPAAVGRETSGDGRCSTVRRACSSPSTGMVTGAIGHRRSDPTGLSSGDQDASARRDPASGHGDRRSSRRRRIGRGRARASTGSSRSATRREGQGRRDRTGRGWRDDLGRRRPERRPGPRGRRRRRRDGCSRGHGVVRRRQTSCSSSIGSTGRRGDGDRPRSRADRGAERGDRDGARVRRDVPGCVRVVGPGRGSHRAGGHRRVRDPERAPSAPRRRRFAGVIRPRPTSRDRFRIEHANSRRRCSGSEPSPIGLDR